MRTTDQHRDYHEARIARAVVGAILVLAGIAVVVMVPEESERVGIPVVGFGCYLIDHPMLGKAVGKLFRGRT